MNSARMAFLVAAMFGVTSVGVALGQSPVGTAFTYQGHLKQSAVPVDELADLEFTLWDADIGGIQVGPTLTFDSQSHTPAPVDVVNGLFTVLLDFGEEVFTGDARWLEVRVAVPSGSGMWQTLSPRQALTPAPYALALRALRTDHDAAIPDVIGGYGENSVTVGVSGATISGGGGANSANRVTDNFGTVGGGVDNRAGNDGGDEYDAAYATVAGGTGNVAGWSAATVGGGFQNTASGTNATVGGGRGNVASQYAATVGGGYLNTASSQYATIAGGLSNEASAENGATVGGGSHNTASGQYAAVAGGSNNEASGLRATVPGGSQNVASGQWSFAAGRRAKANHDGTFVWADDTNADFGSTGTGQFLIRAAGGVGIGTNDPQAMLHVAGTAGVDGIMFPDGTLQTTAVAGSNGIYGTGTANYVPKFTASNTIGDSVIYESAGKIGIGTAAPSKTLDVNGDGLFQGGDASVWYGNKAVTLRQDANSTYLSNIANFVGNGSESNGMLKLTGEGGLQLRYGAGEPPTAYAGLTLDTSGNVGIGTTTPDERLHVVGTVYTEGTLFAEDTGLAATAVSGRALGSGALYGGYFVSDGGIGVYGEATATGGTTNYGGQFVASSYYGRGAAGYASGGAGVGVYGEASNSFGKGVYGYATATEPAYNYGGYFESEGDHGYGVWAIAHGMYGRGIYASGGEEGWAGEFGGDVYVSGTTSTRVLQIRGGSDLSEQFDVAATGDGAAPTPGMLVCIDPKNPGKLIVSSRAYDRTVAGIVSGAGGIATGMLMGQSGTAADGEHPVALSGRVYCLVDASHGPITPGDLLTTSDRPGHAMKVTDYERAQGAIIGKAMTSLDSGRGLVLVLVSLQ